jgi:hypothetical protein
MIFRSVLNLEFRHVNRTGQIFRYEKKTWLGIYEVQVKGNIGQSGHKRVWDMFVSIIGKV